MNLNENDLLSVVNELRVNGYTDTLHIINGELHSTEKKETISQQKVEIEKGYQFEITENAADTQLLFTVKHSDNEKKGLIIDLLGTHYYSDEPISKMLQVPMESYVSTDANDLKYGLKKIYKDEFNKNPDRFEWRKGYPDFPECPFGFGYKALGWDNDKKEYVWLVTSIIRDTKLKTKEYK